MSALTGLKPGVNGNSGNTKCNFYDKDVPRCNLGTRDSGALGSNAYFIHAMDADPKFEDA